jgi:ATP-dependent DNA ligase
LEQVKPATAKNLMMRWIEEGKMNDVITMLGKMSENKKKKILQSFATQEELDKLHEIHRLMLEKSVNKVELNKALDELSSLEQ